VLACLRVPVLRSLAVGHLPRELRCALVDILDALLGRGYHAADVGIPPSAAGDLAARVRLTVEREDPEGLARNLDEMIDRLALLLHGQQQFISQAAHELRSPLTVLYGELSLALRRERSRDDYRRTIGQALVACQSLKQLAEDLLNLGFHRPVSRLARWRGSRPAGRRREGSVLLARERVDELMEVMEATSRRRATGSRCPPT
jgi:signal transduction histidine kinase